MYKRQDTAKQFHFDDYSLIDYNRAGIPLIEIVTRPNIRNGAQAAAYLEKLRQVFLYTDVSDAKMEEGSMRCDVNISIRPFGSLSLIHIYLRVILLVNKKKQLLIKIMNNIKKNILCWILMIYY